MRFDGVEGGLQWGVEGDFAAIEEDDAFGDGGDFLQDMRRDEDGSLFSDL